MLYFWRDSVYLTYEKGYARGIRFGLEKRHHLRCCRSLLLFGSNTAHVWLPHRPGLPGGRAEQFIPHSQPAGDPDRQWSATKLHFFLGVFLHFITGADNRHSLEAMAWIKAILSNKAHPELGQATIPLPIRDSEYDHTI